MSGTVLRFCFHRLLQSPVRGVSGQILSVNAACTRNLSDKCSEFRLPLDCSNAASVAGVNHVFFLSLLRSMFGMFLNLASVS